MFFFINVETGAWTINFFIWLFQYIYGSKTINMLDCILGYFRIKNVCLLNTILEKNILKFYQRCYDTHSHLDRHLTSRGWQQRGMTLKSQYYKSEKKKSTKFSSITCSGCCTLVFADGTHAGISFYSFHEKVAALQNTQRRIFLPLYFLIWKSHSCNCFNKSTT